MPSALLCLPLILAAASPTPALDVRHPSDGMVFVPNMGQWDAQAQFLAQAKGLNLWITSRGLVYDFYRPAPAKRRNEFSPTRTKGHVVRMEFVGGRPAEAVGMQKAPGYNNYFLGNDPQRWTSFVPRYSEAKSAEIYPGVSARWYAEQGAPRYDLIVRPGADPGQIAMRFSGASSLRTDGKVLRIGTQLGSVDQVGLFAYQESGGQKQEVPCQLAVQGNQARFVMGTYDRTRPLVIDPLIWSTFLGGASGDTGDTIAIDSTGRPVLAGNTSSSDFPVSVGPYDSSYGGNGDVFVTKMEGDGSAIVFSTFIGGAAFDRPGEIALDQFDQPILSGNTASSGFPTTAGAFDTTYNGMSDCFVLKLAANGASLMFSTFLGGPSGDFGTCMTLYDDEPVVAGITQSSTFPIPAGGYDMTYNGMGDVFVVRFNAAGSAVEYGTFFGGASEDEMAGVTLASDGSPIVAVYTRSSDTPTTFGAYDRSYNGNGDVCVAKFLTDFSSLTASTFVGGQSGDSPLDVAVDSTDKVIVVGYTDSAGYPTTVGARDTSYGGNSDGFVTKLNASLSGIGFSTFMGGSNVDECDRVAMDPTGMIVVLASSSSSSFPTTPDGYDTTLNGNIDACVFSLNAAGSALGYGTFLGGQGFELCYGLAHSPTFGTFVTGSTASSDFPTTAGAFDQVYGGMDDAFFSKLAVVASLPFAVGDDYAINAGGSLSVTAPGVLSNDQNVGGGTAAKVTNPTQSLSFTLSANGALSYTPQPSFIGVDSFRYKVKNSAGTSNTVTVKITMRAVLASVTNLNQPIQGGTNLTGTVTLVGPAPAGGVPVYFSDTLTALHSEGYSVVVPQGSTNVGFTIPSDPVGAQQVGTLVAKLKNGSNVNISKTVKINP